MLIQMLADRFGANGTLYTNGTQYTVADDLAYLWIGQNAAIDVGTARESAQGTGLVPVLYDQQTGNMSAAGSPVSGYGIGVSANWFDNTTLLAGDSHTRRVGPTLSSKSASLVGYELTDTVSGGAQVYFGFDGYFALANTMLNCPFRIVHNLSVGGETIAQVSARLAVALAKYRPRFTVWMAGTNNVQDAGITSITTADTAAAAAIADTGAAWAKCTAAGSVVLAYTIPPRTTLSGFQRRVWSQLNNWIRQNASKTRGVFLAGDAAKAAGNPGTGNWLASGEYGAISTADLDSIHGTAYGYYLIACESVPRLQTIVPFKRQGIAAPDLAYDATNGNNPLGTLLINGKMLGTAGSAVAPQTGSVPGSWTVQATPTAPTGGAGTIVPSKVTRGISTDDAPQVEELGEWLQVTMTGGTTGAGIIAFTQETQALGSGGAWAIGDVVQFSVQFETDSTNWNQGGFGALPPILEIQFGPNGGTGIGGFQLNGAPSTVGRMPSGVAMTPEVVIPAGITRLFVRILLRGQGVWRLSNAVLRRIPDRTATLV